MEFGAKEWFLTKSEYRNEFYALKLIGDGPLDSYYCQRSGCNGKNHHRKKQWKEALHYQLQ